MNTNLQRVFPIYAQVIAGSIDVKVQIGGTTASCGLDPTNPEARVITLPALPLNDEEIAKAGWGFLYHEGFHAKYSDMNVIDHCAGNPFKKRLLNVIEDIWNEHHMPSEFLASKPYIDAMNLYILNKGWYSVPSDDSHPAEVLMMFILYWGLGYHNNTPALQTLSDQTEQQLAKILSPAGMTKLLALLSVEVPKIKCTQDSLTITNRVITLLEEEDKDPESDESDQQNSGSNEPSADGNTSDSNDSEESLDEDPSHSPSAEQDADEETNAGQDISNEEETDDGSHEGDLQPKASSNISDVSEDNQTTSSKPSNGSDDQTSLAELILSASDDEIPNHHLDQFVDHMKEKETEAACTDGGYTIAKPAPKGVVNAKGNRGLVCYDNAFVHSNTVRKQMQRIILNHQNQNSGLKDTGTTMDQNRMASALTGNMRVFRHRKPQRVKTAAFHVLLDASPSMNYNGRMDCAIEATMAVALAIEKIRGVNLSVTRFPVYGSKGGVDYFADVEPILSSGQKVARSLSNFDIDTCGSTPMANAMWYAAYHLSEQKEDRKIMLIVTDGDPDDEGRVRQFLEVSKKTGIEVMAIGIEANYVLKLFDNASVITDLSQLSNAIIDIVSKAVLRAA